MSKNGYTFEAKLNNIMNLTLIKESLNSSQKAILDKFITFRDNFSIIKIEVLKFILMISFVGKI